MATHTQTIDDWDDLDRYLDDSEGQSTKLGSQQSVYDTLGTWSVDRLQEYHQYYTDRFGAEIALLYRENRKPEPGLLGGESEAFWEFAREYVYRFLRDVSMMQYLSFYKGSFPKERKQSIQVSYCRSILKIPHNRQITALDVELMTRNVLAFDREQGTLTPGEYTRRSREAVLHFLGMDFPIYHMNRLMELLQLMDAPFSVLGFGERGESTFSMGPVERHEKNGIEVITVLEEWIRSPQRVLSIMGSGWGKHRVMLRLDSARILFHQKWLRAASQPKATFYRNIQKSETAAYQGLMGKVLYWWQADGHELSEDDEDEYLRTVTEGVLAHELGHKQEDLDQSETHQAMTSFFYSRYDIMEVLGEIIADYAPSQAESRTGGYFAWLIARNRGGVDPRLVVRDAWAYLADNWFLDGNEDQNYELLTMICVGMFLPYLNDDGTVDFLRLESDLAGVYGFALRNRKEILNGFIDAIASAVYEIQGMELGFQEITDSMMDLYDQSGIYHEDKAEMLQDFDFWMNMLHYVELYSPDGYRSINAILEGKQREVEAFVAGRIGLSSGDVHADHCGSLRECVFDRLAALGVLPFPTEVDSERHARAISLALGLERGETQKVIEQVRKICAGKNYDVSINYAARRDPFVLFLQKLINDSGCIDLRGPTMFGRPIDGAALDIPEEIHLIGDGLNAGQYHWVDRMVIDHQVAAEALPLLDDIVLGSGEPLRSKIGEVVVDHVPGANPIAVYVPLTEGIVDWNTARAIWMINKELRPDEFVLMWTVDKLFLHHVGLKYENRD